MPPRFAYWTIILDGTPTSFRTKEREDILPLFNQLKAKNPAALLKWFSGGRLWDSPEQAKDVRNVEKVRRFRDERSKETKEQRETEEREMAAFREKHGRPADGSDPSTRDGGGRSLRAGQQAPVPQWSPGSSPRPGSGQADPGSEDPLAEFRRQHGRPADGSDSSTRDGGGRSLRAGEQVPAPSDRSGGASAPREGRPPSDRRSKDWRPGGEHKDPRDKYKLPPGEARKRWKDRNLPSTRGRDDGSLRAGGPRVPKPFGAKPSGDRPYGGKPGGDRPYGDRPRGPKPFGSKPGGDRPWGGKPRGPGGDRPWGDKPRGPGGDRPFGDRPRGPKPFGSKPGGKPFGSPSTRGGDDRSLRAGKPGGGRPFGSKPGGGRPFGGPSTRGSGGGSLRAGKPRGPGKPPGGSRGKR